MKRPANEVTRGHNYVTVFIDMEKQQEPVLFVTPGKGKETLAQFSTFMKNHHGDAKQVMEVVCDMSPAFLSGIAKELPNANVTVDWFHIVQLFTKALDTVRKEENRDRPLPKHTRWAVLKSAIGEKMTGNQLDALYQLRMLDTETTTAWGIKEKLRWIRGAKSPRAAKWRITHFIRYARETMGDS